MIKNINKRKIKRIIRKIEREEYYPGKVYELPCKRCGTTIPSLAQATLPICSDCSEEYWNELDEGN